MISTGGDKTNMVWITTFGNGENAVYDQLKTGRSDWAFGAHQKVLCPEKMEELQG